MTKKELEKENAELKQLVEWLDMAIDSDIPIADKLAELKKENVRLKEEIKDNEDLATVAYMQGAERYKPKWHKVTDGDLPKEESHYWSKLVLFQTNKGDLYIGFFDYANEAWYEKSTDDVIFGVIAWKEIILPNIE